MMGSVRVAKLQDKMRRIAREEAHRYAKEMMTLDRVRSSKVEAKTRFGLGKKGWEMSVFLGKTPEVKPSQFYGPLTQILSKKGYRHQVYQEGCGGRDRKPFMGRLRPGYDLVCNLIDHKPMEFRIRVRRIGARLDTDDLARIALDRLSEPDIWRQEHGVSRIYLSARNVKPGEEKGVQAILAEVKEAGAREGGITEIRQRKLTRKVRDSK